MFYGQIEESIQYIRKHAKTEPLIDIILGGELGLLIGVMEDKGMFSYQDIPHFPQSRVADYAGNLVFDRIGNQRLVVMQGRFHYYEGFSMKEVTYLIYVMELLGVRDLIVTNTRDGISPELAPGDLMIIDDFIDSLNVNSLTGGNDERLGPRFPGMSEPCSIQLREKAEWVVGQLATPYRYSIHILFQGSYYETATEIHMYVRVGSNATRTFTMSETIAASYLSIRVLGIIYITNTATGIVKEKYLHEEVVKMANENNARFCTWMEALLKEWQERGEYFMEQNSLFQNDMQKSPLAARLRPASPQDYIGRKHLLGKERILYSLIEKDMASSMVFQGPPDVGKTALTKIIVGQTQAHFISFSAAISGIREVKTMMREAEDTRLHGRKTIVFIDGIYRFNRAQQDAFLPYVGKGNIILIGVTTEGPSFGANAALPSRYKMFALKTLEVSDLVELLKHVLQDECSSGLQHVFITEEQLYILTIFANGDARIALNTLKIVVLNKENSGTEIIVTKGVLRQCTPQKSLLYGGQGEKHYNLISTLHRSMCNSDVGVAIYWLARMLEAEGDPLYVVRRLVHFMSEDVGMANGHVLEVCIAVYQICHFLGMPECNVHLTRAVTYPSLSPESDTLYMAYGATKEDAVRMLGGLAPL